MIKAKNGVAMIGGSSGELTGDMLHIGRAIHEAKLSKEISDRLVAAFVLGALTNLSDKDDEDNDEDNSVRFEELINSDKEEDE